MKVAIIHDWLTGLRGGERFLQAMLRLYPEADIFTLIHVKGSTAPEIDARVKEVSWLNKFPGVRRYYRGLLPLYPCAISSLHVEGYDLVVSLSHAAAKNIPLVDCGPHVCICFTPMRYVWDQAYQYFGKATPILWPVLSWLRRWDKRRSVGVDKFAAISKFVAARIRCFYGRRASVLFPPVETSWITPQTDWQPGEAFLYAGALVTYKRVELAIEACNRLGQKLWIVGSGPEENKLRAMAGPNVEFFGRVSDAELAQFYRRCKALIFPPKEDFGMMPVECMAAGRPVLAFYGGGCKETVQGYKPWDSLYNASLVEGAATGVFFRSLARQGSLVDGLTDSIRFFLENEERFLPSACILQASKFSFDSFRRTWAALQTQIV